MPIICPTCKATINIDDVNVTTDIALCRACGNTFRYSTLVDSRMAENFQLNSPPSGAWFDQLTDGFRVGATTRTFMAMFYIPFTCIWSGFSLWGIYGTQYHSKHFNLLLSLFGIPFALGSIFLIGITLMCLFGRVQLTRHGDELKIFCGIGVFGFSRSFLWSDFSSVGEGFRGNSRSGRGSQVVEMRGKRRITFGSMWTPERRAYVICVLREMMSNSGNYQASAILSPG